MPRASGSASRSFIGLSLVFLLSLPAVTTRLYASDEIQFFSWLHSWTFDHDADFQNEYTHFYQAGPGRNPGFRDTFLERTTEAGRRPNFAPIGSALLWLPFYAVAHGIALVTGRPADGYGPLYIAAVTYSSALYGFLAVLLSAAIARRVLGTSAVSSVVVLCGTPLLFYMYVAPGFSHACSAFAVSLFLLIWLVVRERWTIGGVATLGIAAAIMAMVREQDAFFVLGPMVDFARSTTTSPLRSRLAAAAAGAASFVLAYAPQLAAYQALNGHPGPTRLVTRKMTWTAPHFLDVLFSSQHGLFVWTPLALVAVVGLVLLTCRSSTVPLTSSHASAAGRRDAKWIGAIALLMFLAQVYVAGSVESWTVAGSFGQRRFVAATPLLVLGLAAFPTLPWFGRRAFRIIGAALVLLCIWWNIGLMAQFGLNLMNRQALSPASNARSSFVELPVRMPALVWRYLTDRESFFELSNPERDRPSAEPRR
jgi:hypothetical protein